jgi:hypothetical protein
MDVLVVEELFDEVVVPEVEEELLPVVETELVELVPDEVEPVDEPVEAIVLEPLVVVVERDRRPDSARTAMDAIPINTMIITAKTAPETPRDL